MNVKLFGLQIDKDGALHAIKEVTDRSVEMARAGAKAAQDYADAYREKLNRVAREYIPETMRAIDALAQHQRVLASAGSTLPGLLTSQEVNSAVQRYEQMITAQKGLAESGEQAFAGMGRIRQGLTSLVANLTGTLPVLDRVLSSFGGLWPGNEIMVGALAGLAAVAYAYNLLTRDAREAEAAQDAALKKLVEWNRVRQLGPRVFADQVDKASVAHDETTMWRNVLGAVASVPGIGGLAAGLYLGATEKGFQAEAQGIRSGLGDVAFETQKGLLARRKIEEESLADLVRSRTATHAQRQQLIDDMKRDEREIAALKGRLDPSGLEMQATLTNMRDSAHGALFPDDPNAGAAAREREREFQEDLRRRIEAVNHLIKEQQDAYHRASEEAVRDFEREQDRETEIALEQLNEQARNAKRVYAEETREAERAFKEQQKYAEDLHRIWLDGIQRLTTRGIESYRNFFENIFQIAMEFRRRMEQEGETDNAKYKALGLLGATVGGGLAGYGAGQAVYSSSRSGAGNSALGAISGTLAGAAAGSAFGPLGTTVGALTGFISGILGVGAAARDAQRQMENMQRQVKLSMDALRAQADNDPLGAAIAQVNAAREAMRRNIEDAFPGGGSGSEQVARRNAALREMNAEEDKVIAKLKLEFAYKQQYDQEDLKVRLLRAQGKLYEAEQLAFAEQQQREYEAAVLAGKDAIYLATLAEVQRAEALAHTTAALQDAVRNAPTGFKVQGYSYDFATPAPNPGSTWTPVGGSSAGSAGVSIMMNNPQFSIDGSSDPEATFNGFITVLRRKAGEIGGSNMPASRVIDRLPS